MSPCKEPLHRFGFLKPDKRLNGYLSEKNWLEEHFNPPSQKMINMHGNTGCGVSSPRIQKSIHFVKKRGLSYQDMFLTIKISKSDVANGNFSIFVNDQSHMFDLGALVQA